LEVADRSPVSEVAVRYGVSRQSVYSWKDRHTADWIDGLREASHPPARLAVGDVVGDEGVLGSLPSRLSQYAGRTITQAAAESSQPAGEWVLDLLISANLNIGAHLDRPWFSNGDLAWIAETAGTAPGPTASTKASTRTRAATGPSPCSPSNTWPEILRAHTSSSSVTCPLTPQTRCTLNTRHGSLTTT
jgi:hypothetical protein